MKLLKLPKGHVAAGPVEDAHAIAVSLEPAYCAAKWRWNPALGRGWGHFPKVAEIEEHIVYLAKWSKESGCWVSSGGITVSDGVVFVAARLNAWLRAPPSEAQKPANSGEK